MIVSRSLSSSFSFFTLLKWLLTSRAVLFDREYIYIFFLISNNINLMLGMDAVTEKEEEYRQQNIKMQRMEALTEAERKMKK